MTAYVNVSQPPYMAAWLTPAPVRLMSRAGSTGRISPNPITSSKTVIAMNTSACLPGGRVMWRP